MTDCIDPISIACGSLIALVAVAGWLRARRDHRGGCWLLPAGVAVIILAGWAAAQWRGGVLDGQMRREVLREATGIARAIDPNMATALSFTAADQASPTYQLVCRQLRAYGKLAGLRSVYTMALRDGRMVFGPESLDPADAMASPPGTPYEEPSASDWEVFRSRQPAAFGPVQDEYGTFISGLAPVLDPRTGEVLLVLGVDLPASQWQARITRGRWQAMLIALAAAGVFAGGLLLMQRRGGLRESRRLFSVDFALTSAVGAVLTAIAAMAAHDAERRMHAEEFVRLADATARITTDAFRDVTREIATLARFFEQSDFADAREFEGFAAPPALSHGVQALAWAPLLTAAGRERFEAGMREQGLDDYRIFEQNADGCRVPARERPWHCPVAYVTPLRGNEGSVGFDMASEAQRWAAIEESIRTRLPASSAPLTLVHETAGEKAVLLFHPVFKPDAPRPAGFAVGALRLQTALVKAMGTGGQSDSYAQVQLAELSDGPMASLAEFPQRPEPAARTGDRSIAFPLFVSGNCWAVVVRPGQAFDRAHGMRAGPATALGGLLVSLAIAAAVGIQRNRHASLEQQVQERTSKLRESEHTLRVSEAKLHAIFQSIQTGLLLIDAETHAIVEANPAAERMIGAGRDRIVGRMGHAFICPAECGECPGADRHQPAENAEHALLTISGGQRAILRNATIVDLNGRPHLLESFIDITDRKRMEEELRAAARTDRLTGLANRAVLTDQLEQALRRANCVDGYRFAALFFDMDRFKVINDSLGHRAGDALLVEVAHRLREAIAEIQRTPGSAGRALAARLGGDEFVVVLESLNGQDQAVTAAETILTRLAAPYRLLGRDIYSTASMGVVMSDMAAHRAEDILRDADTAMYEAKTAGKGRHVLFDATMRQRAHDRLALESDLRQALDLGQFHLVYQPIVSLEDGTLESFEALLRWRHPQRGLVSPADFIPIAEECGLIVTMGEWVLREACRQQAQWQRMTGDPAAPRVSVNLSRVQLMQPDLPERISRILEETGADPSRLHLEITESAIMRDQELAIRTLQKLRDLGLKLDLDDFGTGYSSLASLHLFPLDVLKIDRSFVANISRGRDFAALVHAVSQLARNLGIAVVAEGIETVEQLQMLQALDCQFGQGYLFAKPLPADQAMTFRMHLPALAPSAAA